MFHIIVMLILGLIAGALARLIMPGKDPMSLWNDCAAWYRWLISWRLH